jgi:hypothetical protein
MRRTSVGLRPVGVGKQDIGVTWTAPGPTRSAPPLVAGERESLEGFLDYQRATLLVKCAGLTAEQLKQQAVPPSKLSLLGLVRHMTDVERWWVRIHGGQQVLPYSCFTPDEPRCRFQRRGGRRR